MQTKLYKIPLTQASVGVNGPSSKHNTAIQENVKIYKEMYFTRANAQWVIHGLHIAL